MEGLLLCQFWLCGCLGFQVFEGALELIQHILAISCGSLECLIGHLFVLHAVYWCWSYSYVAVELYKTTYTNEWTLDCICHRLCGAPQSQKYKPVSVIGDVRDGAVLWDGNNEKRERKYKENTTTFDMLTIVQETVQRVVFRYSRYCSRSVCSMNRPNLHLSSACKLPWLWHFNT